MPDIEAGNETSDLNKAEYGLIPKGFAFYPMVYEQFTERALYEMVKWI